MLDDVEAAGVVGAAQEPERNKEADKLEKKEQAKDPVKGEVAFIVPAESYALRMPDGTWDLTALVKRPGATAHLITCGVRKEDAEAALGDHAVTVVYGVTCAPGEGPCPDVEGRKFLNTWRPSKVVPSPGEWPRLRRILENITNHDPKALEWVLDWSAFKIQNPGARNMVAPVFQGRQGSGKSTPGLVIGHIIGKANYASIGPEDIENGFNAFYADKLMVLADEVFTSATLRTSEPRIKRFITDGSVICNGKNRGQFPVENRMSWWFTSNKHTPVKVEEGDRRFAIFANFAEVTPEYKAMMRSLFTKVNAFTVDAEKEIAAFAYDMRSRVVDREQVVVPYETEAKRALVRAQKTSEDAFIDLVDERGIEALLKHACSGQGDHGADGVEVDRLYSAYLLFCDENGFKQTVNKAGLGKAISDQRPAWHKGRLGSGKRPSVYVGLPRAPRDGVAPQATA